VRVNFLPESGSAIGDDISGERRSRLEIDSPALIWPILVGALVFVNTLDNGFAMDDPSVFGELEYGHWRALSPNSVTNLVHHIDYWIWGQREFGFHLTNVLLHALASGLAGFCAHRISGSNRAALICGLLFAVHPVHVEAVASFAHRKDLLAMIFGFLLLATWTGKRRSWQRYGLATVFFGLGMFSKEAAFAGVVPMLVAASLFLNRKERSRFEWGRTLVPALFVLGLTGLVGLLAVRFIGGLPEIFGPESIFNRVDVAGNYPEVLFTSLATAPEVFRLLWFPMKLSVDYAPEIREHLADPHVLAGIALWMTWLIASVFLMKRHPPAGFAMTWVFVTYFPVSNVIPLSQFFLAERYLYVPSFGFCLLVGIGFDAVLRRLEAQRRWRLRIGQLALILLLLGAGGRTLVRNLDWYTALSLYQATLESGKETARIHRAMGIERLARREPAQARRHFERAIELRPGAFDLVNLRAAAVVLTGGKPDFVEIPSPYHAASLSLVGMAYLRRERHADAQRLLKHAVRLAPEDFDYRTELAWVLAASTDPTVRDPEQAIGHADRAAGRKNLRRRAWAVAALAIAQRQTGELDQSEQRAREALRLARDCGDSGLQEILESWASQPDHPQGFGLAGQVLFDRLWWLSFNDSQPRIRAFRRRAWAVTIE